MSSLQGKLLLAAPVMEDPNFSRSVVLVIKHDDEGAMGLVLNRPTGATVREAIDGDGDVVCQTDAGLFRGGPCDGPLMVLHSEADLAQETVIPGETDEPETGVYFTVDSDLVRDLLGNPDAIARYFHGYAGWSPGQLDAEMDAGGWLTIEASAQSVFDPDVGSQAWTARLNERGREALKGQINPNLIPPDPTVN
jgi:putative transcriptional regulator